MSITTDTIEFDGEEGRRVAFVEDYVICEVKDGFDIYCDWDDVLVSCTDTLDEAVLYVNQMLGGIA